MADLNLRVRKLAMLVCIALTLSGCEGEVDWNENASGDTPSPVQNELENNDDFLHAYQIYTTTSLSDSLSSTDSVDYFVIKLPLYAYRAYQFDITGLTGDADLEMYNAFLNRDSWSEEEGTADEQIKYWRNYTHLDNNIIYLKVINRSGNDVMYNLQVSY